MSLKQRLIGSLKVNEEEYRANLSGMNTFFGAVIGFVLADVTTDSLLDFAQLLVLTAAIVISVLYISASPRRWFYAALNLLLIWGLPRLMDSAPASLGRLQVTLAVWTLMATFIEAYWAWQRRVDARVAEPSPV